MPIFDITLEDGNTVTLESDQEPTEDDVYRFMESQRGASQPARELPIPSDIAAGLGAVNQAIGLADLAARITPQAWEAGRMPSEPTELRDESARQVPMLSTVQGERGAPQQMGTYQTSPEERQEAFQEQLFRTELPIPNIPISPDESAWTAVPKELANVALGIPKFIASPAGILSLGAAALAPTVTAGAFTADMLKSAVEQGLTTYEDWSKMTPAQRAVAVTDITATLGLSALTGAATAKGAGRFAEGYAPRGTGIESPRVPITPIQSTEKGAPNALQQTPKTVLRDVREPQGAQEGTQPLPATEVGAKATEALKENVVPEITQFRSDFEASKPIPTEAAVRTGMQAKSIADLEFLAETQRRRKAEVDEARKKWNENPDNTELQQDVVTKASTIQLPREAIEGATNVGSNAEGNMGLFFGERPLDWKKNPEVADWLRKNGEALNIVLPDEIKSGAGPVSEALRAPTPTSATPPRPADLITEAPKTAEPELAMAGPGGTVPSDIGVSTSELTQLAQSAPKVKGRSQSDIGISATELLKGAAESVTSTAQKVRDFLISEPKWDSYDQALGQWQGLRQSSSRDAYMAWKDFKSKMPDQTRRGAIAAWVDAGGDRAVMERAASELPAKYADVYKKALTLTPDEITFAKNIRSYFDKRLQDSQDAGLLEHGIENYIRRIYEAESEWKSARIAELHRLSTATPDFARQRFYETDADAIRAGRKPVMDFAGRVLEYDQALNHAIADRAFVKAMMRLKMPDGRPRIDVGGSGKLLPEGDVPKEALLIKPQFKPNSDAPLDNRSDYRPFNHPAFRKYKWVSKDPAGRDVYVQGDVLVHPDAYPQMQRLLETSKIRQHPIGRAALNVSSTIKQTMLDLSLFHPVQIGVHGMEHRVNPLRLKEIDLKDPQQKALVDHGLIVSEDRGFNDWSEGLHGTSLTRHIPGIGPKLQDFHNWMFKEWIPTIKMNMAEHALERNRSRYPKLNEDQLLKLTAEQSNAAFGGLNYRMLGRSQTMQDFLRLAFLAPDFLEARGRFAGQALKGFGREQLTALALGAATLYVTARIANQLINDNPHWEKENVFSIIYNDHAYGLRTVQGDLLHLMEKPGQFWYHRLNPTVTRPLMEIISGRDYFGRQVGIGDVLLDELKTIIPISLRGLTEGKDQNVFESALNAMGITTRRYNAITKAYDLAREWREKGNIRPEPGEFIYDPEKDPLRNLKLALQHEHTPDAVKEINDLVQSGAYTIPQLRQHFERYASNPIAGSNRNQKAFLETLRADQREIVNMAQERKKKTMKDFKAAVALYRLSAPAPPPGPSSPGLSR